MFINHGNAQSFEIKSPDERISLTVNVDEDISWSATLNGEAIIKNSIVAMYFSAGFGFGINAKIRKHTVTSYSSVVYPVATHKDAEILDEYTELKINFKNKYEVNFRAHNDGIAYQFVDKSKV